MVEEGWEFKFNYKPDKKRKINTKPKNQKRLSYSSNIDLEQFSSREKIEHAAIQDLREESMFLADIQENSLISSNLPKISNKQLGNASPLNTNKKFDNYDDTESSIKVEN